jgi:hypothetical protein
MGGNGFTSSNGRTVFDNGVVKIWLCPYCMWWCGWQDERCSGCGAPRENGASQAPNEGKG